MENENRQKESKLIYQKPRLTVIELTADEILAVGCKTSSGRAPGSIPPPCNATNCAAIGS